MTDYIEVELKLRFMDPDLWEVVFALPIVQQWGDRQSYRRERLEAQYFDTQGQHLQKARLAYRIRHEGGEWLATVKGDGSSSGGLHQREEWTVVVAEPIPNIESFMETSVGPLLQEAAGEEELLAFYTTCFERQVMHLQMPDGSIIELAADQGEIRAGDKQDPILELELELISGNPASLLQLGANMARELPLLPEWRSKYFRALQLVELADDQEARKLAYSVVGIEKSGVALAKLLVVNLQSVLMAQENFLNLPDDPDTLLLLMGQLRRLCSMLSFSQPLIPDEVYSTYKASLQQWEDSLRSLHEIDIVLKAWHEMQAEDTVQFDVNPVLPDKLAPKRAELAKQLHQSLSKGETTPFLLELWAWLEEFGQRAKAEEKPATIEEFSRQRLAEYAEKIIRIGKKLDVDNAEELDRLHIDAQKMRYVLQDLWSIWPERARKMSEHFEALQEGLDYLHDVYISRNIMRSLLPTQSSRLMYRDTGFLAGWQARQALIVRRKVAKQWKKVRHTAEALIKKQAYIVNKSS